MQKLKSLILGKRKYVSLMADDETQENLRKYCREQGFNLAVDYDGGEIAPEDFEFHCTVYFTTSYHRMENYEVSPIKVVSHATDFEILGVEREVPVLRLNPEKILPVRNTFTDIYDMEDAWPDYKPHVSLSYAYTGRIPDSLPTFPIVFDRLIVKDQDAGNS
jgi:hypothetical protein